MNIHPKFAAALKAQQAKQAVECRRLNKLQRMALARPEYRAELAGKVIQSGALRADK